MYSRKNARHIFSLISRRSMHAYTPVKAINTKKWIFSVESLDYLIIFILIYLNIYYILYYLKVHDIRFYLLHIQGPPLSLNALILRTHADMFWSTTKVIGYGTFSNLVSHWCLLLVINYRIWEKWFRGNIDTCVFSHIHPNI